MPSNPNVVTTFYKTAIETMDLSVDFSNWLTVGDTVSTHSVLAYEGTTDVTTTLIASSTDDNDDQVSFQIQAGTAGTTYKILVRATTTQADVFEALIYCVVN